MTTVTDVRQEVRLRLQERAIDYRAAADGSLTVDYGSAEISISFGELHGTTIIRVWAQVLDDLDVSSEREILVLRSLDERNRTVPFGKFFLDEAHSGVVLEYEIVGDHLQTPELMNALTTVARLADDHDDLLQREFGTGRRAAERLARRETERAF